MKIERTLDRVTILPNDLLRLIADHIEKHTGRKLEGVPQITVQNTGSLGVGQYIATARLQDDRRPLEGV